MKGRYLVNGNWLRHAIKVCEVCKAGGRLVNTTRQWDGHERVTFVWDSLPSGMPTIYPRLDSQGNFDGFICTKCNYVIKDLGKPQEAVEKIKPSPFNNSDYTE